MTFRTDDIDINCLQTGLSEILEFWTVHPLAREKILSLAFFSKGVP